VSAVPTTPSSSLPAWRRVKLGEICSKPQYGWTTKAKQDGAGLKLLRTTDITSGQIDWSTVPFCTESPPDVQKYLVHEGDILISRAGSVGVSHLVASTQPAVFASYLIRFKPGPDVLPKYLAYFLQSPSYWKQIADNTAGIAVPNVNASKLQELELPLAPPGEQSRIVAEIEKQFSRLDEAVANLKRVKANLARQRAAVLNAAVVGHLTAQRESKWLRALNAGDPLPHGWRWIHAEELAAPEQGSIGAGPFGTIFKAKDFRPEGVPIIFLRHVAPMKYLQHKPGFMDTQKWEELFRPYSVFGGELLITKLGEPPGVCALYPAGIGPAMVTPDVIKMRVDENKAVPAYLMYYFNSEIAKRFATGAAFGTTRTRLTLPLFRNTPVVVPPLDEQHRIVAEVDRRLSIVREVDAEVDSNVRRVETLRRQILSMAFVAPRGDVYPLTNQGTRRHVSA